MSDLKGRDRKEVLWRQRQRLELCLHKPRNVKNHQKLEEAKKNYFLESSRGAWLRQQLDFGCLSSRTLKEFLGFPGGLVVKNPTANAGDTFPSPVQEDPTCCGATKPRHHNYWACAPLPGTCNYRAHVQQLLKPACPRAHTPQWGKELQWDAHAVQLETNSHHCN